MKNIQRETLLQDYVTHKTRRLPFWFTGSLLVNEYYYLNLRLTGQG